jgi:hypothetical protein
MEHGKKIKIRRRVAALAGSAAVIAGAIACVPALAHHQALPSPTDSHTRVTVNPPGPHSPTGTIAVGQIGTMAWNLRLESPGTKNCQITGTGLAAFECQGSLPTSGPDPIELEGAGGTANANGKETFYVSYGVLRKDVTFARVVLANGTVLTLRPTKVYGQRWVAFAQPLGVPVESLTAYSRAGEVATAIPFTGPGGDGLPDFSIWLRPGQAGPARFTKTIASGTDNGRAWTVTDYIGPWGTCIASGSGSYCSATTPQALGGTGEVGFMPDQGSGMLVWGTAADPVSYLVVTLEGGTTIRVGLTAVGQQKYFVFRLSRAPSNADRWTAYDATGKPVKSGSFS